MKTQRLPEGFRQFRQDLHKMDEMPPPGAPEKQAIPKTGHPQPSGRLPHSFLTLNHAAYKAGRNRQVSSVATTSPPMMVTAIGPQNT